MPQTEQGQIINETAILVINYSKGRGQAMTSLAQSLYKKLRDAALSTRDLVSIHPEKLDHDVDASVSIISESQRTIKKLLIREFLFPRSEAPTAATYFNWMLQIPRRIIIYLRREQGATRRTTLTARQRAKEIVRWLWDGFGLFIYIAVFICILPLITTFIIRPLRRLWTLVAVFYLAFFFLLFLPLWTQILPPIVKWISELTNQLVKLTAGSGVTFDQLFPIVSGLVVTAGLSVLALVIPLAKWVIAKLSVPPEGNPRINTGFSYLLDPLYAATVRDSLEKQVIDLSNTPTVQNLVVICDEMGGQLAYEVLSKACATKIVKPVKLMTSNLLLAGFSIGPRTIWIWVDESDWSRFSLSTPLNLSWHHFTSWPVEERLLKLTSRPDNTLPLIEANTEHLYWLRSQNAILIDRILALMG